MDLFKSQVIFAVFCFVTLVNLDLSSAKTYRTIKDKAYSSKEAAIIKRIVSEVIADRDAQIASALFEVAKNQPHLQMMVQTMNELSQSSQRLELSINRLEDAQKRLDGRMGVISEKMGLLESRLAQNERRVEREMTQIHGRMEDFLRNANNPEQTVSDTSLRLLKQIQEQLAAVEELLLDNLPTTNKLRSKSRSSTKIQLLEMQRLSSTLSQTLSAAHADIKQSVGDMETNLQHQLSMLSNDNGVFSCTLSRLLEVLTNSRSDKDFLSASRLDTNNTLSDPLLEDGQTKCILTCP